MIDSGGRQPQGDGGLGHVLERVINNAHECVILLDAEDRILRFNAAVERVFGYSRAEIVGQPAALLLTGTQLQVRDGQVRSRKARRKGGEHFPVELSVTAIEGDEQVHRAIILRDVSEQARLREALVEKERMAAIGLSAAMFAHEVANPLNNMFLHGQLLRRRAAKLGFEEALGPGLELIIDELRRLTQLLHDFSQLYRRDHGPFVAVDLATLLGEVARGLAPGAEDIEQELLLGEDLPPVLGDADKLKQVFINLGKNAIEAMPAGGRLKIVTGTDFEWVTVEIHDTGVGVPADFDPFETFRSSKVGGSGLGLAVVRQIIEQHGGEISYVSEPGRTCFRVRLPICD